MPHRRSGQTTMRATNTLDSHTIPHLSVALTASTPRLVLVSCLAWLCGGFGVACNPAGDPDASRVSSMPPVVALSPPCVLPLPDTTGWERVSARFAPMTVSLPAPGLSDTLSLPEKPSAHAEVWNAAGISVAYWVGPEAYFEGLRATCTAQLNGLNARFDSKYLESDYAGPRQRVYAIIRIHDGRTLELVLLAPNREDE